MLVKFSDLTQKICGLNLTHKMRLVDEKVNRNHVDTMRYGLEPKNLS